MGGLSDILLAPPLPRLRIRLHHGAVRAPQGPSHKGGHRRMSDTSEHHNKNGPGVSRRAFLRGSGAAAASVTALAQAPLALEAQEAPPAAVPAQGPAPVRVTLEVNG